MTGHRPFSGLTKDFTPERRARVAAKAATLREAMTLEELRKARSLSQEDMAATMAVGQPAVARLEKRNDMHVSNLRRYVEALGGTLEITARFPEASVVLTDIGEGTPRRSRPQAANPPAKNFGGAPERAKTPSKRTGLLGAGRGSQFAAK